MESFESVVDYIAAKTAWQKELTLLRDLLLETELEETVKWGAPCYTLKGKNVLGLLAFKDYVGLWFHNGVFMKDPANKFVNAGKGITKAQRQWRFTSLDDMDIDLIRAYINKAIETQKQGKILKPEKKIVEMPIELEIALKSDKEMIAKFNQFTEFKRTEFKEYVASAKQEKTRLTRVEKILPLIEAGIGLNDKYRS